MKNFSSSLFRSGCGSCGGGSRPRPSSPSRPRPSSPRPVRPGK